LSPTAVGTDSKEEKDRPRRIRFFNVSLRNGVMPSTPSYPEKQAFIGRLIHTLESSNPEFAWVQFLFVQRSLARDLTRLKNSLRAAKKEIEQPKVGIISGEESERRELGGDFYARAEARMKKIDDVVTKPTIALAIQGMWVCDQKSRGMKDLPFDHCSDEHDSLAIFEYRDPRMLLELVDRRMVVDLSRYLEGFTRSRLEPPSFIVTPNELQSFVHLPAGEVIKSLHSLQPGTSMRNYDQGTTDNQKPKEGGGAPVPSKLVRLAAVPEMAAALEDKSVQPLEHLASTRVRTFELVYCQGKTDIVLSAETVEEVGLYIGLLSSVYGDLKLEEAGARPAFLQQLPRIVGLTRDRRDRGGK
jgi:hypothetical protein